MLYMNYGFTNLDSKKMKLFLNESDEKYRFCIQLYNHVVSAVDLNGKDVLEVGCGRGGGSSYLKKHFNPKSITGIDVSEKAIDLCNSYFSVEGLSFLPGDAEFIPFKKNMFDVVVNIESSYCYGNVGRFLSEVYRVLRQNGYFLLADYRREDDILSFREQLKNSGLKLLKEELITASILKTLELDNERKLRLIQQKAPKLLHKSWQSLWGTKDSKTYKLFKTGKQEYFNCILQKQSS